MINKTILLIIVGLLFFSCKEQYPQGKRLYEYHCSSCHMSDGSGLEALIPPIKSSDYLVTNFDNLPCIIKYGLFDTIRVNQVEYSEIMIGFPDLNSVEISNIMNYISQNFLEQAQLKKYKIQEIDSILNQCKY